MIEEILERGGDKIGCTTSGHAYRYSDLLKICRNAVNSLHRLHLAAGQRVALILPDHVGTAMVTLSTCCHASVLPLNPGLTDEELGQLCRESGVHALLTTEQSARAQSIAQDCQVGLVLVDVETGEMARSAQAGKLPLVAHPPGLVLFTSGSTGQPKRVPLSPAMLVHSAETIVRTLQLGPSDRAAHLLPMFHIGALVDLILAPLAAGGSVALCSDRTANGIGDAVLKRGATWLQVVPTMLSHLLSTLDLATLRDIGNQLRFVRSVSADLSPELQVAAETALGTPIIQMYGMTEAAGQIASNPLPPRLRKPGSVGLVDGVELSILDSTGSLMAEGREGEICIRGPNVTRGYENTDPAEQFHAGWLRTGDLGRLDEDGYLNLTGRRKEMINRGGEKISPTEIERAALTVRGVKEAAAFAIPHRSLGEVVGLALVLDGGVDLSPDAIRTALTGRLADFKLPGTISLLPALPRLGSGKIDRRRLRSEMAGARSLGAGPQTEMARIVGAVWKETLSEFPGPDDDFFECGGDSLSGVQFILQLERRIGRKIVGNVLFESPRFRDLVARLETQPGSGSSESPVIEHIRKNIAAWPGQAHRPGALILGLGTAGPKAPIFFSSQGADEVKAFRRVLDADRPLYALRTLHGFPRRTIAHKAELADAYAHEINQIQPAGSVFLAGFCEGAEMSDLIARRLSAQGRTIGLVASIDYWFNVPTEYPVLHIWSESRLYSPAHMFLDAEKALPVLHPKGFRAIRIPGQHTTVMNSDSLRAAGQLLDGLVDGRETTTTASNAGVIPFDERGAMHGAQLSATCERMLTMGRDHTVPVSVTNSSRADWPAPAAGGPCLKARLVPMFAGKTPVAAFARLPTALKRGDRADVALCVRPSSPGLMRLELVMADDGFSEFGPTVRRYVWVRRAAHRSSH